MKWFSLSDLFSLSLFIFLLTGHNKCLCVCVCTRVSICVYFCFVFLNICLLLNSIRQKTNSGQYFCLYMKIIFYTHTYTLPLQNVSAQFKFEFKFVFSSVLSAACIECSNMQRFVTKQMRPINLNRNLLHFLYFDFFLYKIPHSFFSYVFLCPLLLLLSLSFRYFWPFPYKHKLQLLFGFFSTGGRWMLI